MQLRLTGFVLGDVVRVKLFDDANFFLEALYLRK